MYYKNEENRINNSKNLTSESEKANTGMSDSASGWNTADEEFYNDAIKPIEGNDNPLIKEFELPKIDPVLDSNKNKDQNPKEKESILKVNE